MYWTLFVTESNPTTDMLRILKFVFITGNRVLYLHKVYANYFIASPLAKTLKVNRCLD